MSNGRHKAEVTTTAALSRKTIVCPRCGYDLRGIVATWEDACPLEGRCSECGLTFFWDDVFHFAEHPWLFDVQYDRYPVRAVLQTLRFLLQPRHFWKVTLLNTPFRPVAAFAFGLSLFGVPWLLEPFARRDPRLTILYLALMFSMWWIPLMALTFVFLPDSVRRARVRPVHLLRIVAYGYAWTGLVIVLLRAAVYYPFGQLKLPWRQPFVLLLPAWPPRFSSGPEKNLWIALVLTIVLLAYWWGSAVSKYLQIPHGYAVGFLMAVLSGACWYIVLFGYDTLFDSSIHYIW